MGFGFDPSARSLIMYATAAELLWAVMIAASIHSFIHSKNINWSRTRGDEYRADISRTRYGVFPGIS